MTEKYWAGTFKNVGIDVIFRAEFIFDIGFTQFGVEMYHLNMGYGKCSNIVVVQSLSFWIQALKVVFALRRLTCRN